MHGCVDLSVIGLDHHGELAGDEGTYAGAIEITWHVDERRSDRRRGAMG
jgi:hypothetical protein